MRKAVRRGAPLAGQGDLFAAPAPGVNPGLRRDSDFYAGPVSQATGGPLNAIEAGRVNSAQSIACAGYIFQRGAVICRGHDVDDFWRPKDDVKRGGYRMTVFKGSGKDRDLGACELCGARVVGEDPR